MVQVIVVYLNETHEFEFERLNQHSTLDASKDERLQQLHAVVRALLAPNFPFLERFDLFFFDQFKSHVLVKDDQTLRDALEVIC